jgi:phosphohistidine phosphatase
MAHQQLWLLRHGEAVPHDSKPDDDRELTPRGERQATDAGEALARLGLEFAACYTSPLARAVQTARLACAVLNVEPEVRRELGKGFDTEDALAMLAEHDPGARLLLLGHEPSFSQVVRDLSGGRVDFKKGGVVALSVTGRHGELLVALRPRELESIARGARVDG